MAEGQMGRPRAPDPDLIRLGEGRAIAVGGAEADEHLLTRLDGERAKDRVRSGDAADELNRAVETQEFLDRRSQQRRIRAQAAEGALLAWVADKVNCHCGTG